MTQTYTFFLKPMISLTSFDADEVESRLKKLEDLLGGDVQATEYEEGHMYQGVWKCTSKTDPTTLVAQFNKLGRSYHEPASSVDDLRTIPVQSPESEPAESHSSALPEQ